MPLIAVTGGIGAGKTTLVDQFQKLGARTADADDIAHDAYLPGSDVYRALLERWGKSILAPDGQINRKAIAAIVFPDKSELAWLDSVVHPAVRNEIRRLADAEPSPLFCAIPLLYETQWEADCQAVIAAWCPTGIQRERLRKRGWDDMEIQRRIASQVTMDEKLRKADYGIFTDCSWECLQEQCRRIYIHICNENNLLQGK